MVQYRLLNRLAYIACVLGVVLLVRPHIAILQDATPTATSEIPVQVETPIDPVLLTLPPIEFPTQPSVPTETPTNSPTLTETASILPTLTETSTTLPTLTETASIPVEQKGNSKSVNPRPSQIPNMKPAYFESFESGAFSMWTPGDRWAASFEYVGLSLAILNSTTTGFLNNASYMDQVAQTDVLLYSGVAKLAVRYNSNLRASGYTVALYPSGQVELYRADGLIQSASINSFIANQWHKLSLSAIGNQIEAKVDGVTVLLFQDSLPLPSGTIAFPANGFSDVVFDNVYLFLSPSDNVLFQAQYEAKLKLEDPLFQQISPERQMQQQQAGVNDQHYAWTSSANIYYTNFNTPGSAAAITTDGSSTGITNTHPKYSRDGNKLAFNKGPNIYLANVLSNYSVSTLSTQGFSPSWSPDGTRLVFSKTTVSGNTDLYIRESSGVVWQLTFTPGSEARPDWSPTGNAIVYELGSGTGREIYGLTFTGTTVTSTVQLSSNSVYDGSPAWSRNGSKISFYSQRDRAAGEMYTMPLSSLNLAAGSVTRVTNSTTTISSCSGAWSPDNSLLMYNDNFGLRYMNVINNTGPTPWRSGICGTWGGPAAVVTTPTATPPPPPTPTKTLTPTPLPITSTFTPTPTPIGIAGQLGAYGVIYNASDPWQTGELEILLIGVQKTGQALRLHYGGASDADTFKRVFFTTPGQEDQNKILFIRSLGVNPVSGVSNCVTAYADENGHGGDTAVRATVTCYGTQTTLNFRPHTAVHELGHVLRSRTGGNVTSTTGLYGMIEKPVNLAGVVNSTGNIKDFNPSPQIVMGLNSGDWQRGFRGWGDSIYNAAPCNFQQSPYQVVDSSATTQQKVDEVDEAAADMFLNWVYTKIAIQYGTATPAPGGRSDHGFVDTSWGGTTNACLTTATPQPTQRPGLARYNYMTDIVMPRIGNNWIPVPTPTP